MAKPFELLHGREVFCQVSAALSRGYLDLAALVPVLEALSDDTTAPATMEAASQALPAEFFASRACHLVTSLPAASQRLGSWCGHATALGPGGHFLVEVRLDCTAVVRVALGLAARYRVDEAQSQSWPPVFIEADFSHPNQLVWAKQAAQKMATTLAEMGLWGRPLHLWLGSSVVLDCLSPYCRELRHVLIQWALNHPEACAPDLAKLTQPAGEHVLYAVAHDFGLTDPALLLERTTADRTVGISHHWLSSSIGFDLVDLGRIDQNAFDARLSRWRLPTPAPVLLRIDDQSPDFDGAMIDELLELLAEPPASVTCLFPCDRVAAVEGTIVIVDDVVGFESGGRARGCTDPGAFHQNLVGMHDSVVESGAMLAASSSGFMSQQCLANIARHEKIRAVHESSGGQIIALMRRARPTSSACVAVASSTTVTGRVSTLGLSGLSLVAVARLQELLGPRPLPHPTAASRTPPARKQARAVRIKA